MWNAKWFKTGIAILLFFLIIYVGSLVSFVFQPFVIAIEALFLSFFVAGIIYYLTLPLAEWLYGHKFPRPAAIALIYLLIAGLLVLLGLTIGPVLQAEFERLVLNVPEKVSEFRGLIQNLEGNRVINQILDHEAFDYDNIVDNLTAALNNALRQFALSIAAIIDFITSIFMTIVIIPFLLYYMLKEQGKGLIASLADKLAPADYRDNIKSALAEMNRMLGSYVQGLGLVCLCVGILAYIGFLLIGLDYALILSIFIMITNIVPFLGPFIGAIPAVIVGILESPLMMLKVVIVIVIVQQVESLLISPQVMGRKLSLSPLAIILIVLVAGRLGGLLGIILAIPVFTVMKIVAAHIYEHVALGKKSDS